MPHSNVKIPAHDGGIFGAYIAMPDVTSKGATMPAIIVIQEIFGVNHEIREKCDALAKQGYIAIAPDLFWRTEPDIQLRDSNETHLARAFELYKNFDFDLGIEDLKTTLGFIRNHEKSSKKVGTIGYCLGGFLAVALAIESNIDAAISYYGVNLPTLLARKSEINHPLMLHIAQNDEFVPPEAQSEIKNALSDQPNVTIHTYEGQDHAFAREKGMHYNEAAASLANTRTAEFLNKYL